MSEDPVRANSFMLDVQKVGKAYFREASGFGSHNEVIENWLQSDKGVTVRTVQPGNMKWDTINLKRGITSDQALWKWRKQVIDGQVVAARSDGTITGFDDKGDPKIQYSFTNGWPSKWSASGMNAGGNDVVMEEIEIAHEGLVRLL
jgi:phage tail-like protein